MLRIRELRLENNLTQKELAEKISSTSKNIWAYENQISIPPLDVLIKLADFFNCSIDYLANHSDDFGNVVIHTTAPAPQLSDEEKELLENYRKCCLSLLYHILETLSIKNFNDAVFGVVFYVLALIQTAGRGIHYLSAFPAASPWRQLSPADKLQHRESRERLSVFLLPYPEARSPGFPVSIIPLFPLFARSGRPPPAPSRYIIYYKHI